MDVYQAKYWRDLVKVIIRFLSVLIFVTILSPVVASAQKSITIGPTIPKPSQVFGGGLENVGRVFSDPQMLVANIFKIAIATSGAIFLVLFLVGGLRYLTASGDEENTGKAKKVLIDAIIGLLIVLAAWAAGTWILGKFGLGPETRITTGGGTGTGGIGTGGGATGGGTGGSTTSPGSGTTPGNPPTTACQPGNAIYDKGARDGYLDGQNGRDRGQGDYDPGDYIGQDFDCYNYGYGIGYDKGSKNAPFEQTRPGQGPFIRDSVNVTIGNYQQIDKIIKEFTNKCLTNPDSNRRGNKIDTKWRFPVLTLYCIWQT